MAHPATIKGYKDNLNRIYDIFAVVMAADDFPISSLNKEHARGVRTILSLIPTNLSKKYPDLSAREVIKRCAKGKLVVSENERLTASTFNTYANLITGLFHYAQREEYIEKNYFENLRIPKQIKKPRDAFTDAELEKFFGTDLFCKKDFEVKWAWRYWVPCIMLYSGTRVEEICQLRLDDIYEVKGTLCFHIRSIEAPETQEKVTLIKNLQSDRIIPVHPKLKEIGLLNYPEWLRTKGETQIFPTLKNLDSKGQHKKYNASVSKWFNENDKKQYKKSYIQQCRITDPSKVLYCFRHTVETFLINHASEIEHDKIDAIMGHKIKSTGRKHYGSYDPETLLRVVSKIDYPNAKLPWDTDKRYGKMPFPWK